MEQIKMQEFISEDMECIKDSSDRHVLIPSSIHQSLLCHNWYIVAVFKL